MENIQKIFGSNTFNLKVMEEKLPRSVYEKMSNIIKYEHKLSPEIADEVAHALKEWAISKGATHYTHWFQPMTGSTAEKHDCFLNLDNEGFPITRLSALQLLQSEPDASSFPSGGMRSTFEARGYTAWDPTSPAFILQGKKNAILCIPSTFMGYYGEALGAKIPLLKSIEAVSKETVKMLHLLGYDHITSAEPTMGAEQEYFLVDQKHIEKRPDLKITGRTIIGAPPSKGQKLDDHYFGHIKDRVIEFMEDFEYELFKLGIPVRTRHNEVAPNQYELACQYETLNIAADHNQLTMAIIKKVALKHGFHALLHEKPFDSINGSGKHNNWSLKDSDGNNLLSPGKTEKENVRFLVFLTAVLKAIHEHGPALRASVASAGNDHRLGANEAPPAIMSVFLGNTLSSILDSIAKGITGDLSSKKILDLGISKIPAIFQDNTDRNRTSPFAFTGDKFEFRAVGSSASISYPNTFLNCAFTEALKDMNVKISEELKETDLQNAVLTVLKQEIIKTKNIRFEGNGYSDDWLKEAEKRNILNLKTTPAALDYLNNIENVAFLIQSNIYTENEIKARIHIQYEQYCTTLEIESNVLLKMINTGVIPAVYKYQAQIVESFKNVETTAIGIRPEFVSTQSQYVKNICEKLSKLIEYSKELENALKNIETIEYIQKKANEYCSIIVPKMNEIREICDFFEKNIDAELWPFPTYDEMIL